MMMMIITFFERDVFLSYASTSQYCEEICHICFAVYYKKRILVQSPCISTFWCGLKADLLFIKVARDGLLLVGSWSNHEILKAFGVDPMSGGKVRVCVCVVTASHTPPSAAVCDLFSTDFLVAATRWNHTKHTTKHSITWNEHQLKC